MVGFDFCIVLCLLSGAFGIQWAKEPGRQRTLSLLSFVIASGIALLRLILVPLSPFSSTQFHAALLLTHFQPYVVFLFCFMGTICVGLSSLVNCGVRYFQSILLLIACALLFLLFFTDPILSTVLWTVPSLLVWSHLSQIQNQNGIQEGKFFLLYQGLSALAFLGGNVALLMGNETPAFYLLLLAIFLRSGIFPFHGWLLGLFETLPFGIVFAYFAPQLGIPLLLTLLDSPGGEFAREAISLGAVFTAFYGATLAFAPLKGRRVIAYLVMSQVGLILFGVMSDSVLGFTGSLITWMAISLSLMGFAMIFSCLEARKGELTLNTPSGCYSASPRMATAFLICGLASVGIPGTVLFLSEDLLFQSALEKTPFKATILILAVTLCAINIVRLFFYLFNGSRHHSGVGDFTPREFSVVNALFLLLTVCSVIPGVLFR